MEYYKQVEGEYIVAVGQNCGGIKISKDEYETIFGVIRECPFDGSLEHNLRTDLTWEIKVENASDGR